MYYFVHVSCLFIYRRGIILEICAGGTMAKNRYAKDYRLLETWDEKGKLKTTYEYIGNPYRFACAGETVRKEKKRAFVAAAAGWLCYVAAMLFQSTAMHSLYVALPFAFIAVPLFLFTDLVLAFRRMEEPLEHRHADRMNNRYPAITLFLSLFAFYALAGEAVNLLTGRTIYTGDWVFMAGALGLSLIGSTSFKNRTRVLVEEVKA